ncbi:MAG: hypothetical protein U1E29_06565 [Coriobacteriia bacterium]|nr:hypothetical protein [Coriobacteriia bacterium]
MWEDRLFRTRIAGREIDLAFRGRCGGMVFLALDAYRAGVAIATPEPVGLPQRSSALARQIMRRQVDSIGTGLGTNLLRFASMSYRPRGGPVGTAATTGRNLGDVLAALFAGNPVPLGLIARNPFAGIGLNHQVLAVGGERDERMLRVRVYDPNHPRRDDVVLEIEWGGVGPVREFVGGTLRNEWAGLFVERYAPRKVPTSLIR